MNYKYMCFPLLLSASISANAQYGTFIASAVGEAQGSITYVVLDQGDSPYNSALMNAIKAEWKFGETEIVKSGDIGASGFLPDALYLIKVLRTDEQKHEATFLTLMRGWKMKKGEQVQSTGDAFTGIPEGQMLAYIMMDPEHFDPERAGAWMLLYVKNLQDYLHHVKEGSITDKTTADRLYQSRNRTVRERQLIIKQDDLDKTVDPAAIAEIYPHPMEFGNASALNDAIIGQDKDICVGNVILTGDHKTMYCFKRIFNAGTGELMFQSETPALYGKKQGFLDEDLKVIHRAR